jgi:hypothetical protein
VSRAAVADTELSRISKKQLIVFDKQPAMDLRIAATSTGPSVDIKSRIACWCANIGVGIGGKNGLEGFDLGGAVYY